MKKDKRTANLLPSGTFFYMLPFGDSGQSMTREMLFPHFPEAEGEKQNIEDRLGLENYVNGVLTAIVYLNDGSINSIYLHIGLEAMYIACSCGMPGKKLCHHAFIGLQKIIGHGSFDFGMYFWPDIETDEKLRRKFLNIEISQRRIFIEPGYRYGRMFKPGVEFGSQLILTKKLTQGYHKREKVAVGYCLVFWLKVNLFMYDEVKELIYLMASVQDDELLIWLSYERYRITILKVYFREFHHTFLARLSDHYEVLFSHSGSKKIIPYDFVTVMKSIG
jgi:hypothetical protein